MQIAISFAAADVEFAKKIGEMLEQMSYIDECDTLGQKSENKNIHKVVSVLDRLGAHLTIGRPWYPYIKRF